MPNGIPARVAGIPLLEPFLELANNFANKRAVMCLERMDKVQTYRVGAIELIQCRCCKGFGLRIGTAYLSFQPSELPGFYHWMLDIRKKEATRAGDHERVYLQLQSSRVMLALTEGELNDLCSVLEQGLMGASAGGPAADGAPIPFPTSQAVN